MFTRWRLFRTNPIFTIFIALLGFCWWWFYHLNGWEESMDGSQFADAGCFAVKDHEWAMQYNQYLWTSLNSLLPSSSSPFLVPVGGLSAPLPRAYWLKGQSKVPQITFTKAVWRKWNPSVMRANIPTNAEIRALDGGAYGSAEILHLVASPWWDNHGDRRNFFSLLIF